jgi:ABC-type multidrug transport system fused ATPase/permease subunit
MSEGDRRARALPLWGRGEGHRSDPREASGDRYGFASILRLFLRAWPFIYRQIEGEWRERPLPRSRFLCALAGAVPRGLPGAGYAWMPPLLTALVAWGASREWLAPAADARASAQAWGALVAWAPLALVALAWATLLARGRTRVVLCALGAAVGLLGFVLSWAFFSGTAPRLYALALAGIFAAGWLVRGEQRGDALHVRLRTRSHMAYYYGLLSVSRGIALASSAFMIGLLYQNVLLGEGLTPQMASFLGLPEHSREIAQRLSAEQRFDVLRYYAAFTVGLYLIQLPFAAGLPYYLVFILQRINQDLRLALVERWQRLSLRYHSDHRVGDSIYRIYQDSAQVTALIGQLAAACAALTAVVTSVFLLWFLSPAIAGIAFLIGVPVAGWGRWFSPRMRVRSLAARQASSDLTSRIQEVVSGVRVIKAYGAEQSEQERFEQDSVAAFNAAYAARSLVAVATIMSFSLTTLLLIPGEYLMALWARAGGEVFAAPLLALFCVAFARWNVAGFNWTKGQFFDAGLNVRLLSRQWAVGQDMAMGLHRVFDILDIEPDVQDAPSARPMPAFRDTIRFEGVSFGYRPDQPVLKGISFSAGAGTITAIVGPTGAGKSTLVTLLLRLFDPDRGRITIDGSDLRELHVESLRQNVAIALQENLLFSMSVADNIRYVVPEARDDQVREAARIACADEFIAERLPRGYDSELGDHGGKLSTGERQRLSIARALIKNAPILVLDEPTAALDAETEHRVMHNLAEWGKDRVIFLITHRLSTVRQADQILYLEDGELREIGRHAELMRVNGGRYRALVEVEEQLAAGARAAAAGAAGAL